MMVPPKLTLVSNNEHFEPESFRDAIESLEATELALAISEVEAAASGFTTPSMDRREKLRIVEAVIFASPDPVSVEVLAPYLGREADVEGLLAELQSLYATRGVNLVRIAGKWTFRTAPELSYLLEKHAVEERRLSKAALETMAIIAYHQPVTRAEIEDIRGVTTSAGTLDILLEQGWIRPRGRRRAPGKPLTYGTTDGFLSHFGLDTVKDLPGLADLKAQGLLDGALPPGFTVPDPKSIAALMPDELPLEAADDDVAPADDTEADDDEEGLPYAEGDAGAAQPSAASEQMDPGVEANAAPTLQDDGQRANGDERGE